MEDRDIIRLFQQRDEAAIAETDRSYGRLCRALAGNLLHDTAEAESCVSAAYFKLWQNIPPKEPAFFRAYLCKIVRSEAISALRAAARHAPDAGNSLEELSEILPSGDDPALAAEGQLISETVSRYLKGCSGREQTVFLLRYFFGYPVARAARAAGITEGAAKMLLLRMRRSLSEMLTREGINHE